MAETKLISRLVELMNLIVNATNIASSAALSIGVVVLLTSYPSKCLDYSDYGVTKEERFAINAKARQPVTSRSQQRVRQPVTSRSQQRVDSTCCYNVFFLYKKGANAVFGKLEQHRILEQDLIKSIVESTIHNYMRRQAAHQPVL